MEDKKWLRFWRHLKGYPKELQETYILCDKNISETELLFKLDNWGKKSKTIYLQYKYGYENISCPPKEWLEKTIKQNKTEVEYHSMLNRQYKKYLKRAK